MSYQIGAIKTIPANLRFLAGGVAVCICLALVGCGGKHAASIEQNVNVDPLEKTNRAIHGFNNQVDKILFKPTAQIYLVHLPQPLRTAISNFFRNLAEPTTVLNDVLQGKGKQAVNDSARFSINTTLGVFGLFDIASSLGLAHHKEDYGQTLARWGIPDGPYLVLPIFGPSNLRDAVGKLPALMLSDPLLLIGDEPYLGEGRYGLLHAGFRTLHAVDLRAQLLAADPFLEIQLDPYVFVRETYFQKRQLDVQDGSPPNEELDDLTKSLLFGN
ncbi:MAG: ABC transporter [Acidiferrobacteraceae bacterium]|nr:ABC transporter [Acidiferrobacteraceae bacterium]